MNNFSTFDKINPFLFFRGSLFNQSIQFGHQARAPSGFAHRSSPCSCSGSSHPSCTPAPSAQASFFQLESLFCNCDHIHLNSTLPDLRTAHKDGKRPQKVMRCASHIPGTKNVDQKFRNRHCPLLPYASIRMATNLKLNSMYDV